MIKKILFTVLLTCVYSVAYADKYTVGVVIESVETLPDGGFIIIADRKIDSAGCYAPLGKTTFKVYITNNSTESAVDLKPDGAKALLSVTLAALATDRTVDIYHGETLNCLVTRVKIIK